MSRLPGLKPLLSGLALAAILCPHSLWACAACYGQSDSPMAQGMNWGIMSLMGMILGVLGCFVAFFVFLARRAAAMPLPVGTTGNGRASVPASPISRRFPGALGIAGSLPHRRRTEPLLDSARSRL